MNVNRIPRVDISDIMGEVCKLYCSQTGKEYGKAYAELEGRAFNEDAFPTEYTITVNLTDVDEDKPFTRLVKEVMKREGLEEIVINGNGSRDS